jgi:cathepsin A (carboxypeptidase C)
MYSWACEGPYAVFQPGSSQCVSLEAKQPRCQNLIASCQRTNSRFACVPAGLYCWQLFNDIQQLGVNVYDVRRKCNRDKDADGPVRLSSGVAIRSISRVRKFGS